EITTHLYPRVPCITSRNAVMNCARSRSAWMHDSMRSATPLVDLLSVSRQLARKLSELSKRLSHTQGSTGSADPAVADRAATEYRRLTRQCESALAEIRVRQGPVIILIAGQYSCSAIIVPTSGDPHHVPLPAVSLTGLNNLENRFAMIE
ncbi:hypothetical protein BD769DRAFT_1446877, partial [Suillus cothurnatus]